MKIPTEILDLVHLKEKLKKKFTALTDSGLVYEEDEKDELLVKLQITLAKTKQELNEMIECTP